MQVNIESARTLIGELLLIQPLHSSSNSVPMVLAVRSVEVCVDGVVFLTKRPAAVSALKASVVLGGNSYLAAGEVEFSFILTEREADGWKSAVLAAKPVVYQGERLDRVLLVDKD